MPNWGIDPFYYILGIGLVELYLLRQILKKQDKMEDLKDVLDKNAQAIKENAKAIKENTNTNKENIKVLAELSKNIFNMEKELIRDTSAIKTKLGMKE